jgi:copper chaperone CopZ
MKKVFTVNGMKCEHCKAHVENALNGLNGVTSAVVSLADHNVNVDYDEAKVTPEQMKEAIDGAGHYEMEL